MLRQIATKFCGPGVRCLVRRGGKQEHKVIDDAVSKIGHGTPRIGDGGFRLQLMNIRAHHRRNPPI